MNTSAHVAFDVYNRRGLKLTTVFYVPGVTAEEVKRGLVEHDGYTSSIVVINRDEARAAWRDSTKLRLV